MQQNELEHPKPLVPSPAAIGISELDHRIEKLHRSKAIRSVLTIVGAVLSGLWLVGYISATADSNAHPASVAILGPILTLPLLFLGIILVIVGVVGRSIMSKRLDDAQRTRELLIASLGASDEEGKPALTEVH